MIFGRRLLTQDLSPNACSLRFSFASYCLRQRISDTVVRISLFIARVKEFRNFGSTLRTPQKGLSKKGYGRSNVSTELPSSSSWTSFLPNDLKKSGSPFVLTALIIPPGSFVNKP